MRRALADSIRSRRPYAVNVLLGGYDEASSTPHLYWIDYLGTMAEVPYAAHGYGAYFALSTLDRFVISYPLSDTRLKIVFLIALIKYRYHDPAAPLEEGLEVLKRCIDEIKHRMAIGAGNFKVRVVDRDGAREVDLPESV